MSSKAPREGFLDALRFFAALSVVLFHYGFRGYAQGGFLTLSFPELSPAARYGYLGVQLFFMISGYVILWSINGRTASQFAVHRFIRLYPTFWLCVAITLMVEHATHAAAFFYPDHLAVALNFTMVPSWFGYGAIDGVYWTLAIELQFYILVALAVATLGFERLTKVLFVWLLGRILLSQHVLGKLLIGYFGQHVYFYPGGDYYAYFCIGGACYLIHRNGFSRTLMALLAISLVVAVGQVILQTRGLDQYYHARFSPFVCVGVVVTGAGLIFASNFISRFLGNRANKVALFLGGLTYPLYLIHQMAGYSIMDAYFDQSDRWVALISTIGLMLAAASAIYLGFDRPVRANLRRLADARLGQRLERHARNAG